MRLRLLSWPFIALALGGCQAGFSGKYQGGVPGMPALTYDFHEDGHGIAATPYGESEFTFVKEGTKITINRGGKKIEGELSASGDSLTMSAVTLKRTN